MSTHKELQFTNDVVLYPVAFIMVIWIVFWLESRFNINLNFLGIYPQTFQGLKGILFSPFIHGSLQHIFNNSIPLFVLSTALFYFYRDIRWKVLLGGLLLTGILTWFIGRPSFHIGASGIIYMLAAFLFFKGVFSKQYQLIALSLVVVFLYGSLLWYLFPIDEKISWEGHLSGFLVGILFALVFRKNPIETKKFEWQREDYKPEEDPFLQYFDKDGNFIEKQKEEEVQVPEAPPTIQIHYTFKKADKEEGLS